MTTRRYTLRDQIGALAHGARLLARHRGNLTEVQAELDREREWARFRARHGVRLHLDSVDEQLLSNIRRAARRLPPGQVGS